MLIEMPGKVWHKGNTLNAARSYSATICILMITILSAGFLSPVWSSTIRLYASFSDDFFYYLKIASNYLKGQGLSFSPGIPTNGFQPLYQYLIIFFVYLADLVALDRLAFIR